MRLALLCTPAGYQFTCKFIIKVQSVEFVLSGVGTAPIWGWELRHTPYSCAFVGHWYPFSPHFEQPTSLGIHLDRLREFFLF